MQGRITWAVNATPSWQLNSEAIGPNAQAQIDQRLISEEPMVSLSRRLLHLREADPVVLPYFSQWCSTWPCEYLGTERALVMVSDPISVAVRPSSSRQVGYD